MAKKFMFSKLVGVNFYCIRDCNGDYWHTGFGWIKLENPQDDSPYSVFTMDEKNRYNLPVGGHWELM